MRKHMHINRVYTSRALLYALMRYDVYVYALMRYDVYVYAFMRYELLYCVIQMVS